MHTSENKFVVSGHNMQQCFAISGAVYRVYAVALVEVEASFHADAFAALQLPKHQLTCVALNCMV